MLSIIIPTLNAQDCLPALLAQIRNSVPNAQIIVSDGGSQDDTLRLAAGSGAILVSGQSGRGRQLRRACRLAQYDWMLILHADSTLHPKWLEAVERHMFDYPYRAGFFDLEFDTKRWSARFVEGIVRYRCFAWGLPYGDQGLLISKVHYNEVGGYADVSLFEDVMMSRAIGNSRLQRLKRPIITSAEKFEREGFFRRGWKNLGLLWRFKQGESPEELMKAYP